MQNYPIALVDKHFEQLLASRKQAQQLLDCLAEQICHSSPRIRTEKQAQAIYKKLAEEFRSTQFWHAPKIRFGKNTLCSFSEPSDETVILQDEDIFSLDIGPVFAGFEADLGQTYVIGANPEHIKLAKGCEILFQQVAAHWRETRASGTKLYDFAEKCAEILDVRLMRKESSGHIISDFPHKIKLQADMENYPEAILPSLWVLEIQIQHKSLSCGAFYEDILLEN